MHPVAERKLFTNHFGFNEKINFEKINFEKINLGKNPMEKIKTLEDHYQWLRDDDRKDQKVIDYLNQENEYANNYLDNFSDETETIFNELKSYTVEEYKTYPLPKYNEGWNSRYKYYIKYEKNSSYPIHCRFDKKKNIEQVLLDENIMSKGKTTFDLTNFRVTDDHDYMFFGVDTTGNEIYKIFLMEIKTKKIIDHNIPDLVYCNCFQYKSNIIYFKGDSNNRIYQIWKYNMITRENELIYENLNEKVSVGMNQTCDRKYFIISACTYTTSDLYLYNFEDNEMKQFCKRIENHKYYIEHHNGKFFILTNIDNCQNFKIMTCKDNDSRISNWENFIEYNKKIYNKDITVLSNYILIGQKINGEDKILVIDCKNNYEKKYYLNFKMSDTDFNVYYCPSYYSNQIIISYDNMITPTVLIKYDLDDNDYLELYQKKIPNYKEFEYDFEKLYIPGHDHKMIPISIVYKKSKFNFNGKNKLFLYGYGSYGVTVEPHFNKNIIPLLDRGFVYCIAHVRGGGYLGEKWYESGKLLEKKNTFYDFISVAEFLIDNKYTFKEGITIEGRSAGGLLVGASMTMRPDLFRTVVCGVPFVDLMNTMADPNIPLTVPEWEEWGNPHEEEYFRYMLEYSPYDNIKETEYPNVFVQAGFYDPRVQYWEPAKFVAKLRHFNKSDKTILLKTEMDQGHFGGSDRYKYLKEKALVYSFILSTY